MYRLVVDDERTFKDFPDDDTLYARHSDTAIHILERGIRFDEVWLDHDLGGDDTVMKVVDFLVEHAVQYVEMNMFKFPIFVHSMNPVGAQNIVRALERYYDVKRVPLPECI